LASYKYSPEEMETLINFDNSSDTCYIYTCNKTLQKKLDNYCSKFPDTYKLTAQDSCSKSYTALKKYISIRAPKIMTKEHKIKLQKNAKKMLESQGK
jgi:hypothetical protein